MLMPAYSDSPKKANYWQKIALVAVMLVTAAVVGWQLQKQTPPLKPTVIDIPEPVVSASSESSLSSVATLRVADTPAPTAELNRLDIIEESPVENSVPDASTSQLPSLANSDAELKRYFSEDLSVAILSYLVDEHLVRKFVRAVNALEDGKLVSQYRPFVQPQSPFEALNNGEQWQLSEDNYRRYTPYITVLEQLGSKRMLTLFEHYQPLLEEAFAELGTSKADFRVTTRNALQTLLDTPEIDGHIALTHPSVMYKFADPKLESMPSAQKLMIRIGPDNRQKVKQLCRDLLAKL